KNRSRRVIAPDPAVEGNAAFRWSSGRANLAGRGGATPAVKPTVRSPAQSIRHGVMARRRYGESVQYRFRGSIWNLVGISVREEKQPGRAKGPHSAMANFDARQSLSFFSKNFSRIETAVAVRIFENQNAIPKMQIELERRFRIGVVFRNPQSSA